MIYLKVLENRCMHLMRFEALEQSNPKFPTMFINPLIDFIEEFNLPILHSGIEYLPPAIDIQVREQEIQILYGENN